jgi:uncharacterized protein (UPF0210 family)
MKILRGFILMLLAGCWSPAAGVRVPVRTITAFVKIDPADAVTRLTGAAAFLKSARAVMEKLGYTVQTVRVATTPAADCAANLDDGAALALFTRMDSVAQKEDFALSIGPLDPGRGKLAAEIFRRTKQINASMVLRDAADAKAAANLIVELSRQIPDGSQNFRFGATAQLPPGSPFFPGGYASAQLDHSFALGAESPALFREGRDVARELGQVAEAGGEVERATGWHYAGLDTSPAPAPGNSIAAAIEKGAGAPLGSPGTLAAAAAITTRIKGLKIRLTGYCGLMLPVLEDEVLAQRVAEGRLKVYSLLLYSAVCGTGLDTVPIPGDVSPERIAALLQEVALLAGRWNKPLTARLFPVPGKKAGDEVRWKIPHLVAWFRVMDLEH